jgi:two-component system sensor histidine kinase ChiS
MKRILIADSEPYVLRVLRMSLEKEGYAVELCTNGRAALDSIQHEPPDVLITEIQMSLMDGEELCRNIEQCMPERKFPIFVLTSLTEIEHREWSSRIGNLHLLEKPVSVRELSRKLATNFTMRSAS